MSIKLLKQHRKIAWDMDDTLINGPHSKLLRDYIIDHPEQTHHIITFRTGPSLDRPRSTWAEDALHELVALGVPEERIAGICGVPEEYYRAWVQYGRNGIETPGYREYLGWKAFKAREIGATALVDDREDVVADGCKLYGITFIHSHSDDFYQKS
jgi:hypothetical protein